MGIAARITFPDISMTGIELMARGTAGGLDVTSMIFAPPIILQAL